MTTSEDIAIEVRKKLLACHIDGATVEWQRHYGDTKEIVIVPHTATGEGSMRTAVVKVNIHCPDIYNPIGNAYEADHPSLIGLLKEVIAALRRTTLPRTGINWVITMLDPAIKEPSHNEHFVSVTVEAHIREKHD